MPASSFCTVHAALVRVLQIPPFFSRSNAASKRVAREEADYYGECTRHRNYPGRRPVAVLIDPRSLSKDLPEHCSTQGDSTGDT